LFLNHEVLENTDDVLRVIVEQCDSSVDLIECIYNDYVTLP